MRRRQSLDEFSDHVGFDVHRITRRECAQRGVAQRVLNHRELHHPFLRNRIHGETHAVHGDGAVRHGQRHQFCRHFNINQRGVAALRHSANGRHAIHMSLHEMSAEPIADGERAFEIHTLPLGPRRDRGAVERGDHRRDRKPPRPALAHREARPIHGNRLTVAYRLVRALNAELPPRIRGADAVDGASVGDEASEHSKSG